ncbi:hypothetical protein HDU98_003704, partial [Podochytrium sp. JEL0797]
MEIESENASVVVAAPGVADLEIPPPLEIPQNRATTEENLRAAYTAVHDDLKIPCYNCVVGEKSTFQHTTGILKANGRAVGKLNDGGIRYKCNSCGFTCASIKLFQLATGMDLEEEVLGGNLDNLAPWIGKYRGIFLPEGVIWNGTEAENLAATLTEIAIAMGNKPFGNSKPKWVEFNELAVSILAFTINHDSATLETVRTTIRTKPNNSRVAMKPAYTLPETPEPTQETHVSETQVTNVTSQTANLAVVPTTETDSRTLRGFRVPLSISGLPEGAGNRFSGGNGILSDHPEDPRFWPNPNTHALTKHNTAISPISDYSPVLGTTILQLAAISPVSDIGSHQPLDPEAEDQAFDYLGTVDITAEEI